MQTTTDQLLRRLDRATITAFGGWAVLSLLLILGTFTSLEQAESTERNAVLDRAEAGANALEQTMMREFEAVSRLQDLAQVRLQQQPETGSGKPAKDACVDADDPCMTLRSVAMATRMIDQQMSGDEGTQTSSLDKGEVDKGEVDKGEVDRGEVDRGDAEKGQADKSPILQILVLRMDGSEEWHLRPHDPTGRQPELATKPAIDDTMRDPHNGLVVSPPVIDPNAHPEMRDATGWVVHASRALVGRDGLPTAIAVVSLDPVILSDTIGHGTTTANGEASVVQLRGSGEIIARSVNLGLGLTLAVSSKDDPVLQHAKNLPGCLKYAARIANREQSARAAQLCQEFRDRTDGVDRLVGFGAPLNVPIVVSRSFDTEMALADFYGLRQIVLSVVLALVMGALVATRLFLDNFLLRQRLGEQATRDPLTGLHNRRYFTDTMGRKMANAARQGDTAAVLLIDLDGFKQVNDTRGHPVGDALLRDVGHRLRHCVAAGDTVIRLGGDEFAIVRIGRPQRRDVTALARYIVNELSEIYEVEKYHVRISASVGIAMPPDGGEDLNDLLRSADIALYFVKSEGGAAYQLFDPAMENTVRTRRALEIDLREALGRGELEVYYQPLVQLDPYRVSGFEALLRWHHPTLGMVMPSRFIPVAEETGLITPIGEWVLRQACMQAAQWPGRTRVAVNLSPIQFERSDIIDIVAAALRESHLDPERLELEITEGVVMRDSGDVLATMRRLRNLGVRLALDDFGTGYASLSYLRSFPFDKVKIDGSFLADLGGDGGTIIRAVLGLCRHLDLDMLVEGVETEDQLDWLRREGCTEAQGHLFSPPRPASGVAEIIGEVAGRAARRLPEDAKLAS